MVTPAVSEVLTLNILCGLTSIGNSVGTMEMLIRGSTVKCSGKKCDQISSDVQFLMADGSRVTVFER